MGLACSREIRGKKSLRLHSGQKIASLLHINEFPSYLHWLRAVYGLEMRVNDDILSRREKSKCKAVKTNNMSILSGLCLGGLLCVLLCITLCISHSPLGRIYKKRVLQWCLLFCLF